MDLPVTAGWVGVGLVWASAAAATNENTATMLMVLRFMSGCSSWSLNFSATYVGNKPKWRRNVAA
jgi:hypothetical protein